MRFTHTFLFYGSQRTGKIVAYIKKAVLVTKSDSWHSKGFQQKPSAKRERHGAKRSIIFAVDLRFSLCYKRHPKGDKSGSNIVE